MFIIDAGVNIDQHEHRTDDALRSLSQFEIDSAIIYADTASSDLDSDNRYVLLSGQEFECHPFYYLGGNPFTDTRMDFELPPNLEEYAGVRWKTWFGESPDRTGRIDRHELDFAVMMMESAEFEAIMSALAYYGKPIIFEEDFGVTAEFVARYHELNVIIPHMGTVNGGTETVVGRFFGHKNIYFTTSRAPIDQVVLSRLGPERLLYASDYPHADPAFEIEKIKRLDLGDEDEALVFGENAERLLGINPDDALEDDENHHQ